MRNTTSEDCENVARENGTQRRQGCIQQRYILAVMGALCIMTQYMLKVNLSVGIVAMVKPPKQPNSTDVDSTEEEEREFSWDMETQGHILSAYYYGYMATQFFGGYAANRWGGKIIVGPGVALTGLFTLLSPIAARGGGPWAFFAMRFLQGLCSGVIFPGMHYMFSVWIHPEERSTLSGFVFSAFYSGSVIGMAASGPLSKWPLEGGGWPMVFYFFGTIAVVLIIPWWLLIYDDPESHPRISQKEKAYILKGLGREQKLKELKKNIPVPWKRILTDIHVWTGIIYRIGVSWTDYTILAELPTYMKNVLLFEIEKLSFLSSLPSLLSWLACMISGSLSQWLRKKGFISHLAAYKIFNSIAALGSTACLLGITQSGTDAYMIVALLALNGFISGVSFGGSILNHLDLALNFAGVISGILLTVVNITGIVIPPLVSEIVEGNQTAERWSIVFYISASITVGTCIMYLIFGSVEERPWNKIDHIIIPDNTGNLEIQPYN